MSHVEVEGRGVRDKRDVKIPLRDLKSESQVQVKGSRFRDESNVQVDGRELRSGSCSS